MMTPLSLLRTHKPSTALILAMLSISALLLPTIACQGRTKDSQRLGTQSTGLSKLERIALISPTTARELGYRIMWQMPGDGHELQQIRPDNDAIFLLDDKNYLTRINRKTGQRLWQKEVLEPATRVLGLNYVPSLGFVHVMTQGDIYVLNAGTGGVLRRDELVAIAATPGTTAGPFLLYGARSGRLVWYGAKVGYIWKSYRVSSHMHLKPQLHKGKVVAVGSGGVLMCLDAAKAIQLWSVKMLDEIAVPPAVTDTTIFAASLDQHLRAFDLQNGSVLWSKIFETPLRNPPIVIEGQLFITIPGLGLVSYDAQPVGKGVGKELWNSKDVSGNVIGQRGGNALVWDDQARVLTLVERAHGTVIDKFELPNITKLMMDELVNGTIYATNREGAVIRLSPRSE